MGSFRGRARLTGFVLIAVFAQIGRNWLLLSPLRSSGAPPWTALGSLPARHRHAIERAYFVGLGHLQIARVLGVAPAA